MRHSDAAARANSRRWLEGRAEDSLGKTIPWLQPAYVGSAHARARQQTFLIAGGVWTAADNVMLIRVSLLNKHSLGCVHTCEWSGGRMKAVCASTHTAYSWGKLVGSLEANSKTAAYFFFLLPQGLPAMVRVTMRGLGGENWACFSCTRGSSLCSWL